MDTGQLCRAHQAQIPILDLEFIAEPGAAVATLCNSQKKILDRFSILEQSRFYLTNGQI